MTPEQRERKNARRRAWRAENKERYLAQTRLENARRRLRPEVRADAVRRTREWREQHPERFLDLRYSKYGLTYRDYLLLSHEQEHRCAICRQYETAVWRGKVRALAVDHCHETGKVRGLLCQRCNHTLGRMGDSPALLRSAADYLEASCQ